MERRLFIRAWKVIRNAVAFVLAFAIVVMMLPTKARSQLGLGSLLRHHLGRADHDFKSPE